MAKMDLSEIYDVFAAQVAANVKAWETARRGKATGPVVLNRVIDCLPSKDKWVSHNPCKRTVPLLTVEKFPG